MFTWLQTHIQKHHKIVFGVILVVVIISFVFTIGNFGGFGAPANPNDQKRNFYGFNLNSNRDMSSLQQWSEITLLLNMQRYNADTIEYMSMQRAVKLYLADELGIPEPTDAQFKEYVREQMAFKDFANGSFEFSNAKYTEFLDAMENNARISQETLVLTMAQNYRIAQVDEALGGPGYVLPYMAVEEIKRRDSVWSIDIAEMPRANFNPEVEIVEEELVAYYDENKARYRTKPMISADYVEFVAADYTDQVTAEPTDAQLQQLYYQKRAQWPKNDAGVTMPLDEVREQVIAAWKLDQAKQLANNEANKLAVELYDAAYSGKVKQNDPSLTAFLEARGLSASPLPPFSQTNMQANGPLSPMALMQAINLDDKRFYTDGIVTDNGAAIILIKEKSATSIPPLGDIRDRVVAEYQQVKKRELFNQISEENQQKLQAAVDEGKSFTETAEALGMTVESYQDFTMANPPEAINREDDTNRANFILSTVSEMNQGEVSNLVGFGDVGTIVYVAKRDIPEVSPDSAEVTSELSRLTSTAQRATRQSIVNELIAIGADKLDPKAEQEDAEADKEEVL